ncbi:16S rRNA (uracil(1498)-N(3))-methyltransferase [Jongsikchunia kroppenstedtii]|uniref:16S rRNA (uracil(1498)-N(3))-methyltransferase n=1 Tax=Jongsikchunia kroppenstedtii TaxID=1121721 RepID=UPI00037F8B26|nr:16S rRNA (uracil(1498)-N(3))-methyltransferase [Jongsikchunia kroppenstedtii]
MSPPLFWVDVVPAVGAVVELSGAEGRHAVTVTRIVAGQEITVSDGAGVAALCAVESVDGKDRLTALVRERTDTPPAAPIVTLVQALPKGERSELAIELATEAGVDRIVPWQSQRCVARWDGGKAAKGVAKWRGAAATAAKQSRRSRIPEVDDLVVGKALAERVAEVTATGGVVALLHESATVGLAELPVDQAAEVMLVVGPEGGLDDAELDYLTAAGGRAIVLGPHVLRTSTAAAVALGALGVLTNRWQSAVN